MFRAISRRLEVLRNPSSLGAKLLLILTGVGVVGSVAIMLLLASVIIPSFNQLEKKSVDAHVERTRAALGEYAAKVESAVRDYGDWNSSYDYMEHQTPAFEQESFSTLAMENLGVNGMAYVANDGRIVIARWRDGHVDNPAMQALLVAQIHQIDFRKILATHNSGNFFVRLGSVVAAVGVAEVRRSDGSGRPRGYVLMARRITSQQLSALLQLTARPGDHADRNADPRTQWPCRRQRFLHRAARCVAARQAHADPRHCRIDPVAGRRACRAEQDDHPPRAEAAAPGREPHADYPHLRLARPARR
jgi:hypothetical protein